MTGQARRQVAVRSIRNPRRSSRQNRRVYDIGLHYVVLLKALDRYDCELLGIPTFMIGTTKSPFHNSVPEPEVPVAE